MANPKMHITEIGGHYGEKNSLGSYVTAHGVFEYWSTGVLGRREVPQVLMRLVFHHSNTPSLQHSIFLSKMSNFRKKRNKV